MTQTYYTIMPSPVDNLLLVSDGEALTGLYMEETCGDKTPKPAGKKDPAPFRDVVRQLSAYFEGDLRRFDLPIRLAGTEFQQTVWSALRELDFGQRISYGELARRIGRPSASRAVGLANGRNPIGIIVPCHRVIGASGSLTGYGGGLKRKQWLLEHERDQTCPQRPLI
ncbi:MAG TPA: methylated-DNA--[protein]-cysteine S-methyltransferase [Pirellulales bacterium]|jgi:methylated-DNA-[protein]-cysteine S-methyltransferase|nr:methylated-DNA--[protein]-cysteine S-methyltransferase [Pirellulales bacterium]